MDLELVGGVSAVVIIIGFIQLLKGVIHKNYHKYGGVIAVVLGIAISFGYTFYAETEVFNAVIVGLAIGLSAAGLYSTQKNARED